jgi:hypothetical protein
MLRQACALVLGLGVGILLAGILVAVQLTVLPDPWRTGPVIGASSLLLVALCVLAVFALARGARE